MQPKSKKTHDIAAALTESAIVDRRLATLSNPSLTLDMLEWITQRQRTWHEVMETWRTSCPRLPVWEDAVDTGLVTRATRNESGTIVTVIEVTRAGRQLIQLRQTETD